MCIPQICHYWKQLIIKKEKSFTILHLHNSKRSLFNSKKTPLFCHNQDEDKELLTEIETERFAYGVSIVSFLFVLKEKQAKNN